MFVFGKRLQDYLRFVRTGMILILAMGVVRFVVGASGVPYDRATHLVSLTILTLLLAIIYGQRAAARGFGGYRHLLPTAFMLSGTQYGFIILGILVEGLGGIQGYFHAPGSGQAPPSISVGMHMVGQLIVMVIFTVVLWGLASLGYVLSRYLGYLRKAFQLLAAMAVLRVLAGAAGVPYTVGTWLTSLTLLAIALSIYYGYRAPSQDFSGYVRMVVVGSLVAACHTLLIVYGIAVTEALGIPNYFHAPGEGFQPIGMSAEQHSLAHLQFSVVGMILMSFFAVAGFALGKRKAATPVGPAA